ncbi:hypothetical protein FI667_g10698, partial [Globisporangium splendens]
MLKTLALLLASAALARADESDYEKDEEMAYDAQSQAPQSFVDFLMYLAPVLKYYMILLAMYGIAKYLNRMVEAESDLKEREMTKASDAND